MEAPTHYSPSPSLFRPSQAQTTSTVLSQSVPETQKVVDTSTFDLYVGTRKRRRRSKIALGHEASSHPSPAPLPSLTPLPSTPPTPHQTGTTTVVENTKEEDITRTPAIQNTISSNTRVRNTPKQSQTQDVSSLQLNLKSTLDDKTAGYHQFERVACTLLSGRASESDGSSPNEKVPKSSFRRTSSTRSALSLSFDISQNQTISRSDSFSSRCESRQGKYHTECTPVEDPSLKIENRGRLRSAQGRRSKSGAVVRPGSDISLLGRRESVTNLIYAGESNIDGEDGGWETVYWKKLQLQNNSRSSSLFSRMASSLKGNDVTPGEFDVVVDDDYSLSRQFKVATPTTTHSDLDSPTSCRRGGFLYQVTDFDRLSKDVPAFVRHYAQKSGKMVTESFILRLNYLRRRRALGEVSTTINIGSSGNNNSGRHSNSNAANVNSAGKRSSPAASFGRGGGFLYQVTDFDRLSKDVPAFVRHYAQKSGKMVTESFILRLNYLRRRRALGEVSTTINIGSSGNNNSGRHSNSNAANVNSAGKRSSPAASFGRGGGFLYQVTDFDRLSKDVPAFVRHYAQKSSKMVTESFILRLNYLRRRRALGEVSTTINIGSSSSSNNNNSSHGGRHSNSNAANANSAVKRSSPAAAL